MTDQASSIITAENAEAARAELAAHDYAQQLAAVQAENARRAEARAALAPFRAALAGLAETVTAVKAAVPALAPNYLALAQMADNICTSHDLAVKRLDRIEADLQPAPEPIAPPAPAPASTGN